MSLQLALGLDQIAAEIHRVWDETKAHQVAAWEGYFQTGRLLADARGRFASDKEFGQWVDAGGFRFSQPTSWRLMTLARREDEARLLIPDGMGTDIGIRTLHDLLPGATPASLAPLMSSETGEWFTPRHVLDAVTVALGTIDLDPCAEPGKAVPATSHFTEADDGLQQPWRGRVYMNPPYGKTIGAWVDKLADEYEYGNVTEAVALVPARTDTSWWAHLPASAVCFITGRLAFSEHENSAPFPSAACYLGKNERQFAAAFIELGLLYVRLEFAP